MSNIRDFIGGGGIRLAPDASYPEDIDVAGTKHLTFDPHGALTSALSLTGAYLVDLILLSGLPTAESVTIKLTIDGTVIWNYTTTTSVDSALLIGSKYYTADTSVTPSGSGIVCRSSFLLQVQTASDTSVTLHYNAKAIL